MSEFKPAIEYVLQYEKGFVNHPMDKGGPTNWGLSYEFLHDIPFYFSSSSVLKTNPGIVKVWDTAAIREMNEEDAINIYYHYFWKPIYEQIESQDICNYYFDMVVHHGEVPATKMLQRSLWAYAPTSMEYLKDDGVFGNKTLHEINGIAETCWYEMDSILRATRAQYLRGIVARDPEQKVFLDGWLKRAYGLKL